MGKYCGTSVVGHDWCGGWLFSFRGAVALKRRKKTFSKKAVQGILYIALFDLQLSYLLAFLGREQIAETLSITVVTEVIAVILGYFLKAYFETREEEKVRLIEQRREIEEKQVFVEGLRKGLEDDGAS
ncbi:hypothetical protein [Anaerotignum sp. MB30-C6]|uniref:hypothetical protein n=1 Tax=Anaerotignum sp. MB30-C6 TaxID=3070814 RepID=UPI0027DE9085|nr:hypothetical protein [Anaerotignum sp. MB30-C6]WMI80341.1 hypothetical protein RBQ60_10885 [Anaerotignum sp. MB30-C6]